MFRSLFASWLAPALLIGCASQTPYQPAEERGKVGYSETQLTENRYRITFTGNSRTPSETVQDYALLRAAELTLQEDYEWFLLASREQERDEQGGSSIGTGFGGTRTSVAQRCGLLSCDTVVSSSPGFGGVGFVTTQSGASSYTTRLDIVMGKGERPDSIEIFDAQELASTLRRLMKPDA